jgi:hypothetical protein
MAPALLNRLQRFRYVAMPGAAAMICILHVARDEHSLPAGVLYESLSLLGIFVLAEIGNEHVGTLAPWRF